jgi:hypothetical protein
MEDLFISLFANVGVILLLVLILKAIKKVDLKRAFRILCQPKLLNI